MNAIVATLAIVAILVISLSFLAGIRRKPEFVVTVRGGGFRHEGKVPRSFVRECENALGDKEIGDATIRGFREEGGVSLEFHGLPARYHQVIRNLWSLYGA